MLSAAISEKTLKKITLSKPADKKIIRSECRPIVIKYLPHIQVETFLSDGKAIHENIPESAAAIKLTELFISSYRQINIMTTGGNAEAMISSKGKLTVIGKLGGGSAVAPASHDKNKNNILKEGNRYGFLVELGVTDGEGRIFDRKRAKFRQIDRFLHYINDIYEKLPKSGELFGLDLCCGKSYLTFAAYWFLTEVKHRNLEMIGADLKSDVIEFCSETSKKLGYKGLKFICCDISEYAPEKKPNLVLSLHACDVATDIVLNTAARLNADVILSTPCCHHQMMNDLRLGSRLGTLLSPIMEHSLLKQKLCVALTDAIRCKRLQAEGYAVDVTELIDPENTPKNLLIRAVKRASFKKEEREKLLKELNDLEGLIKEALPL